MHYAYCLYSFTSIPLFCYAPGAEVFFATSDYLHMNRLFKIFLFSQSNTVKFGELLWSSDLTNFCIVQFHGDFFVIQQVGAGLRNYKLTLHKIDKNGNIVKVSENYVSMQIIFADDTKNKICSKGIYQNEEERLIFCSKYESRGICHSYAIKENHFYLTEIYNRPKSTINISQNVQTGVFGLTFNRKLVCPPFKIH